MEAEFESGVSDVLMAFDPPNSKIYYSNTFLNQFGIVQNSDEV